MQALSTNYADEGANMGLCPICKVNYITDEENVCGTCVGESELSEEELDALYAGGNKETDPEDEITDDEDDLEIISLEMEEEEEIEEEDDSDPLDDFDDSLDDDDEDEK